MSGTAAGPSGAGATSSSRSRKRRTAANKARQADQQQLHHQQHPQQEGGFNGSGPRGGYNQMPPPGMHGHVPQLTGMGLSSAIDEDPADFILDDLDRLSSRDVAIARYKRNHELINLIFDARRIDSLSPPSPSPYAGQDATALRDQLGKLEDEIGTMRTAHTAKYRRWRQEINEHDALLHAPPKRLRRLQESGKEA